MKTEKKLYINATNIRKHTKFTNTENDEIIGRSRYEADFFFDEELLIQEGTLFSEKHQIWFGTVDIQIDEEYEEAQNFRAILELKEYSIYFPLNIADSKLNIVLPPIMGDILENIDLDQASLTCELRLGDWQNIFDELDNDADLKIANQENNLDLKEWVSDYTNENFGTIKHAELIESKEFREKIEKKKIEIIKNLFIKEFCANQISGEIPEICDEIIGCINLNWNKNQQEKFLEDAAELIQGLRYIEITKNTETQAKVGEAIGMPLEEIFHLHGAKLQKILMDIEDKKTLAEFINIYNM